MKVAKTAPDALKLLWKGKFFLKPKSAKEVAQELERLGYNFHEKTLMNSLRGANFLTRKGKEGSYTYVQKYPYTEEDDDE